MSMEALSDRDLSTLIEESDEMDSRTESWETPSPRSSEALSLAVIGEASEGEVALALPEVSGPKLHSRFYVPDDNVTILVEDTLFKIPSYPLLRDSPKLKELLQTGTSPVALPEVLVVDFERVLSVIFRSSYTVEELRTVPEWISVLKLATEWRLDSLRHLAVTQLTAIASDVDKIVLARMYQVPNWLLGAHHAMCVRAKGPTDEEVARLAMPDLLGIFRAREQVRATAVTLNSKQIDQAVMAQVDVSVVNLDGGQEASVLDIESEPVRTAGPAYCAPQASPPFDPPPFEDWQPKPESPFQFGQCQPEIFASASAIDEANDPKSAEWPPRMSTSKGKRIKQRGW